MFQFSLFICYRSEPRRAGGFVDVMVSDLAQKSAFHSMMEKMLIPCREMIADVQALLNAQSLVHASSSNNSYYDDYHPTEEVYAYLDSLAAEFPAEASVSTLGKTYGGKDIRVIHLSTDKSAGKKTLWFDGGIHAREWIAVPTVVYIADTLLHKYAAKDAVVMELLSNFDVMICPIINVDGYDYTWAKDGDRMWRKTRSANSRNSCPGTDPNRNWDFHWGEAGANTVACSESYQGSKAASEIEIQTVQNFLCQNNTNFVGYINFHSYSQTWMSNWGYTDDLPADFADQNALSAAAVAAIKSVHGKVYEYGTISRTIYPASGSSADYTYGVCGIKYSYGVELRDTGEFGFLLPSTEIIPTAEEIFEAILAMASYIQDHP
jgi:carboxypeptidase A1